MLLFTLLISYILPAIALKPCYYPDGSIAEDRSACNESAENSACCATAGACLSNGYCLQQAIYTNRIARQACTDPTWTSPSCPYYCADGKTILQLQYMLHTANDCTKVAPLNNSITVYLAYDTPNGVFCCHANYNWSTNACEEPTRGSTTPFSLEPGLVVYNRSDGSTQNDGTAVAVPAASAATATTTVIVTAEPTTTGSSDVTAVAAGIAVPLATLLIAALVAVVVLVSRIKKLKQEYKEQEQRLLGINPNNNNNHMYALPQQQQIYGYDPRSGQMVMQDYPYGPPKHVHEMRDSPMPFEPDSTQVAEVSGSPK